MTVGSPTSGGGGGVYRFILTGGGLVVGDYVTIHFAAGAVTYGGTASVLTPPQSLAIAPGQSRGYIDVNYALISGSPIDSTTINGNEFTIGGAGASGVTFGTDPLLVASSSTSETFRYFFTGSFSPGPVTVQFIAGSWADLAGDLGTASTQAFQAISQVAPNDPQRVFFISVSGELILNDAGITSQPLLDIYGGVTVTIGAGPDFTLSAAGSVVVYKLGNVASAPPTSC